MSQIISSRRSFLTGIGVALITVPAICRSVNLMPVKQMLILPDRIEDITFPITGEVRSAGELVKLYGWEQERLASYSNNEWKFDGDVWQGLPPNDVNDRWERMKRRELIYRNHEWDGNPIT